MVVFVGGPLARSFRRGRNKVSFAACLPLIRQRCQPMLMLMLLLLMTTPAVVVVVVVMALLLLLLLVERRAAMRGNLATPRGAINDRARTRRYK
jgi:O-antigen/teichoic acid export membrane protein